MTDTPVTEQPLRWKAAIWAGLISGVAFMMLEMMLVPLFMGGSPWAPPRMIAAMVMGKGVLPPPATFDIGVLMAAMAVHFPLSIVFTLILAWIIARFDMGVAVLIGAVFGLTLYLVNFYGSTAIFPWFAMARNGVTIFTHIMFGVIAALAYKQLVKPTA